MILILILASAPESDKEKFNLIFTKYKNLMLHKAYEILKDPYLAEDAVSDAFLRIYRNMGKIDDPLSNRSIAFIVTITKNAALTLYKKTARIRGESMEAEALENIVDEGSDLESYVISNVEAEKIYMLIDGLNEKYKQAFLLKYAHGYSNGEIARSMGVTEGNALVILHRAKKELMILIDEHGNPKPAKAKKAGAAI